jgi:release factor glutamine methyltransferase
VRAESSDTDPPWTVKRLLSWTQDRFAQSGIETPRVDAEHLLADALGCTRMSLYVEHDKVVDETERARFRELVKRRLAREPVAYILQRRGFHALDLELFVDRRVLVPRPETELLVDWILEELRPPPAPPAPVLDVGTGSGAIALALKRARGDLLVTGAEVSADALAVAQQNAARAELEVTWTQSDLLDSVRAPEAGWSVVAANLPYIATDVLATLQPEVRLHEPALALDGGADGLDLVRRLVEQVARPGVLSRHGALYLEIGFDQGDRTAALMREAGLVDVQIRRDAAGHPRIVRGFAGD